MNGPVPFDCPAVERGVGFFETVLLVGSRAVLWEPHLARLLSTVGRFDLPLPTREEISSAASAAVRAAPVPDGTERGLRISFLAVGADLDVRDSWRLDVSVRPIPELTRKRREGARAVSLPGDLRRDSPSVKSTSYFAPVMGLRLARRLGGDEGLFRASDGSYLEGTSTGLVVWERGGFRVAEKAMLGSVTAAAFLGGRGRPGAIGAAEIRAGSLLLGSLTKAVPVLSLDGEPCARPEAMLAEVRDFNERLSGDAALQTPLARDPV